MNPTAAPGFAPSTSFQRSFATDLASFAASTEAELLDLAQQHGLPVDAARAWWRSDRSTPAEYDVWPDQSVIDIAAATLNRSGARLTWLNGEPIITLPRKSDRPAVRAALRTLGMAAVPVRYDRPYLEKTA